MDEHKVWVEENVSALDFLAWLEMQPGGKEYSYTATQSCAFALYLKSKGLDRVFVGSALWSMFGVDTDFQIPPHVNDAVWRHPRTFAAAARRLRSYLGE